jgi:hypothetical protein
MSFLGSLGSAISGAFSLGENTHHTLDSIDPENGKATPYGSLGDFANKFDQSAERRYVEEGYLRENPYDTTSKQFEVLFQEPNATVFIKKRMFSSVGDNFRPDFMDVDEQLYFRSMKVLFQNKCAQIAALEKLSKIHKITEATGSVSGQMMPLIMNASDALSGALGIGSPLASALGGPSSPLVSGASDLNNTIDRIRRVYGFNTTSPTTSWITDSSNLYQSQWGQGTGVIEITNFSSLTTTTSTDLTAPGNFSLTIMDPYESMLITEFDIEKAISDASNMFYNSKIFQFTSQSAITMINDKRNLLNRMRGQRNASPISFKVDPNTLLGRRVTAIIDRLGIELPFNYDSSSAASILSGGAFGGGASVAPEYLLGGSIAGNDGLSSASAGTVLGTSIKSAIPQTEISVFNDLIGAIYNKISLDANSQAAFQTMNANTNYTRRKLRFNFSGKLIIQPMDVVHIYISSKSRYDNKLLSGLPQMFAGGGMLQNLNNTVTNITNAVSTLFNPSGNVPFQIEKAAYVGADFPNSLWSMVRSQFVTENEGTHVFGGVVDNAISNWASGKFVIDVKGRDNTAYLEQGKVNFKPGVDTFNGAIFDPLTPFKSSFDTISSSAKNDTPVLLDENEYLLGNSGAGRTALVKHKLGRYAGQMVSSDSIIQDRNIDPVTGRTTKIFYAPDGLVYKWKEGIGVFTQFGSNLLMNSPNISGNPNVAKEPFAGQDVMNVISLCVTGQPYNFATYFKAAQQFGNIGTDPLSGQNGAHSYMQSLRNDLVKNNTLWGNFIPFKNLVVDEASYALALQAQGTIVQQNEVLNTQLKKLQDLNKQAMVLGAVNFLSQQSKYDNPAFPQLKQQITDVQKQINSTTEAIQKQNSAYKQSTGQDTSYEASSAISPDSSNLTIRKQLNYLTRRMSYNVRANEDKNLFIVDDSYDKDLDIMAYEQSLTDGIRLYNSEFTSVKEKVQNASQLLNLEVFCDSQGHIRCRPPQYNKMPSSVFNRMMHLKQKLHIQVFPQFLDDLFNTQLDSLRTNVEILEDSIRLDCAILNHKASMSDDSDAASFILTNNPSGGSFAFISDPDTGMVTEIQDLVTAANPDQAFNAPSQALADFGNITRQAVSTKDVFSNTQKYTVIIQEFTNQKLNDSGIPTNSAQSFQNNPVIDQLVSRIQIKSGQIINKNDYLLKSDDGVSTDLAPPSVITVDIFKVVSELSDKIKARQQAVKLFYNTIKNASEYQALDQGTTGNSLAPAGVLGNSLIPPVFANMIEDETYDDYGIGSGSRYIIKRAQIRNITISENPPPWTTVEVHGIMNPFAPNALPEGLNSFPGGGNGLVTALAVDYDMWRNYGFKEPAVLNVPFLSDPVSQCGPYASMLLSRNRKNILKGSVTISGNEYQQPGEVVFIEDRQLLFYVTSVTHSFTFGTGFTTTLNLTYGHTPGEYIPTVMDAIGKFIYNNKDNASLVVQRQETSANEVSVGVVQLSTSISQSLQSGFSSGSPNSFSATNAQVIQNIMFSAAYQINTSSVQGNGVTASIELRIYADGSVADPMLSSFADSIKGIMTGSSSFGPPSLTTQGTSPSPLPANSVNVSVIDLTSTKDRRSPSQQAMAAARNQVNYIGANTSGLGSGTSGSIAQPDKIKNVLTKYIVDCWVVAASTTS